MSSPTDRPDKPGNHLAYAPKWVRDSNREGSHETSSIAGGEFPQRSEQSVPKEGLISDQARTHRPLDEASLTASLRSLREARLAPRARRPLAERELPEKVASSPRYTCLARWIRSS